MPSPFPGMDPFIENQCWTGFHNSLIVEVQSVLAKTVRPRYVVDIEEEVYLAADGWDPTRRTMVPDVAIRHGEGWLDSVDGNAVTTVPRCVVNLPMTEPIEIPYLVIRKRSDDQVVTVIEILSPTNKSARGGRRDYAFKRNGLLHSHAHLVELDLLRGGERLPTVEMHPEGDYFAFVSRVEERPKADVYGWNLDQPMPGIPIPLTDGDPDVPLDLQAAFSSTYDRAGYDYSLKYDQAVEPDLNERQQAWVRHILGK